MITSVTVNDWVHALNNNYHCKQLNMQYLPQEIIFYIVFCIFCIIRFLSQNKRISHTLVDINLAQFKLLSGVYERVQVIDGYQNSSYWDCASFKIYEWNIVKKSVELHGVQRGTTGYMIGIVLENEED